MHTLKPIDLISLKPSDFNPKTNGITASLLMHFLSCRIRFLLGINLLKLPGGKQFFYGSIFHNFLDNIYSNLKMRSQHDVEKIINRAIEAERDKTTGMKEQEVERDREMANILGNAYLKFYAKDFTAMKNIRPESEFDIMWCGYRLRGKIDLSFQRTGQNRIMEHKNFSQIKDDEVMKEILLLNFQTLFYITAKEQEIKKNIDQVDYNIIRVPRHEQGKTESFTGFLKRFEEEVKKKPEHFFKRYPLIFTQRQKVQFKIDLFNILQELEKCLLFPDKYFYRNLAACEGRKYTCDLVHSCFSGKLIGMVKKERLFEELEA